MSMTRDDSPLMHKYLGKSPIQPSDYIHRGTRTGRVRFAPYRPPLCEQQIPAKGQE